LVVLLGLFVEVPLAHAEFGITPGSARIKSLDASDQPENRAGAHPDRLDVGLEFNTVGGSADGNVKDLEIELPPGLTGDSSAVPTCSRKVFDGGVEGEECPAESQVGVAVLEIIDFGEIRRLPIFNVEPAPSEMVALGIAQNNIKQPLKMELRSRDYGTTLKLEDLIQALPISSVEVELWGIPADRQQGTTLPRRPFLTLPTRCDGGPLEVTFQARSWQAPNAVHEAHADAGSSLSGCDALSFKPDIAMAMSSPIVDTPSGVRVDITAPASEAPDGRASAQVRDATIVLPEGMSLSPAGAAGLEVCSDAKLGLGTAVTSNCPAGSRVGTVELVGSQFRVSLTGDVYLGQERPGERFRLFVVARGPGVEVKLVGVLHADPVTGQLTVELSDLPQFPFDRLTLDFADGPQAPLATSLSCGPAVANAGFESYGGGVAKASSASIEVGNGGGTPCPEVPPFAPAFIAGTQQPVAGQTGALAITLSRRPGEQLPDRFGTVMPLGFSAALGAVEPCASSAAATGSCPVSSRIGSVAAEVGSGSEPVPMQGSIYLTGPYRGAPFGLLLTFRVLLRSFDLGTIAVRGTLRTDSRSAQVSIETGSLPRIIEGVPIRFQTIGLDIDRPGFILNPTSCAPGNFEATITAVSGATSHAMSPFVLGGCRSLRFHPLVSMALRGAKQQHQGGNPAMEIRLKSPQGSTNLRSIEIPFPRPLKFDSSNLREICARQEAADGNCPAGSQVGTALARTPLLSRPMHGSIYVVQPPGNGLPDLWTDLNGGGIRLAVRAETKTKGGRLEARLVGIPDVPMPQLTMRLDGGDKGILVLREGLCHGDRSRRIGSSVALEGQDRAYRFARVAVAHPRCGGVKRRGTRGG
jgi:hypothetical protein